MSACDAIVGGACVANGRVAFGDGVRYEPNPIYRTDTGNSYPDFLERDLNAQGLDYHVVNAGIIGLSSGGAAAMLG